jgi:Flp pilus assembly protein CpaB
MAGLAGSDRKQQLHSPQRTPRCNDPDCRFDRTRSVYRGEPIREPKLVKANGSGFMAAILPTGMRAISTEISPETGAGGFILPNDRVDVILSRREKNPDRGGSADIVNSEVILANVRVLAIDQAPKEKDGQSAVIGKTVTLELRPEQGQVLARARQSGTLSLALRSIADASMVENRSDDQAPKRRDSINVVRYGVSSPTTTQK